MTKIAKNVKYALVSYNAKINWFVFFLVIAWSWGGWLEIFSVWAELPLMVHELPEATSLAVAKGWRLPSIITMIVQLGQIGSLTYLFTEIYFPSKISFRAILFTKLVVCLACTFLYSFFWNATLTILGSSRSFGMLLLSLIISLCDGCTTMASIPFITSKFSKQYIVPYYIGETLIGVIPSALALLQGTGEDKGCHNVTSTVTLSINGSFESVNETRPESIPLTPRFSVSTYFLIIFVFLFGSFVSFTLLNFVSFSNIDKEEETKEEEERSVNVDLLVTNPESVATDAANNDKKQERKNLLEKRYLLFLNFMVTFIVYGILPALNSYSTLPYGNHVFHASINMGTIFMPIFIIASLMVSHPSVIQITIEFMIAVSFSVYILVLSFQSPCPILLNSVFGPILSVLSWYLSSGFFTRVRCLISTRLAQYGEKTLLYSGAMTLVGEIVGGSIMFVLVEHLRLFTEKEPCVPSDCPNSF